MSKIVEKNSAILEKQWTDSLRSVFLSLRKTFLSFFPLGPIDLHEWESLIVGNHPLNRYDCSLVGKIVLYDLF